MLVIPLYLSCAYSNCSISYETIWHIWAHRGIHWYLSRIDWGATPCVIPGMGASARTLQLHLDEALSTSSWTHIPLSNRVRAHLMLVHSATIVRSYWFRYKPSIWAGHISRRRLKEKTLGITIIKSSDTNAKMKNEFTYKFDTSKQKQQWNHIRKSRHH